jgi:hypothetical protein
VQTVALSWQHSGELAAAAAAVGGLAALATRPRVRAVGAFLREAAVIGVLYGLWQLAGRLSGLSTDDAFRRAHWIAGFERDLALPAEHSVQHVILGHSLIVQTANLYYATMHFTMLFVFLFWLFVRHRERYRLVRSVLALTTLCCLLVQLIPVAPPRMLPGVVDTAMQYGQSVYSNGLAVDQLSAMPSVHVAWAVFVGYYAWRVSPSRWRYLGWAHAVLTVLVVVVTGNHWWLDGIVAVLLLVLCAWAVVAARRLWSAGGARLRARRMPAEALAPALVESAPSPQR